MFVTLRMIVAPFAASVLVVLLAQFLAAAEADKGQADLDRALEARIDAKSIGDLDAIIKLSKSALDKGLNEENTKFAKKLLASTYYQRGETVAKGLLESRAPSALIAQMRVAAVGDLSEAVENDPEIADAYLLIARLQVLPGGDPKQAKTMIEKLLTLKNVEPNVKADALLIHSAFRDKPEERLKDLDQAVELDPGDPQPLRLRAAVKLGMDKPAEAVADFDAALKLDPTHAATHEARGLALAAQKKWDEAKESLTRAADLVPRSPAAILQRGRVNMLAGDMKSALADAKEALEITPDMPEALLLRSQVLYSQGDKTAAMKDIDNLLERFPNAPGPLRTRITFLIEEQKIDEALGDLDRLAKLEPEDGNVLLQAAVLQHNRKNHEETIDLTEQLLIRDPANWRAYRLRGDSYLSLGKQKAAIEDYEAALKIEPKDSGLLNNLAWVLCTSPDDKLRNGNRARELAELACEVTDYKVPHMLSTLGAAYAELGDFNGAKKWLAKAIEFAEDKNEADHLREELASYEAKKPWREAQTPDKPAPQKTADKKPDAKREAKQPADKRPTDKKEAKKTLKEKAA